MCISEEYEMTGKCRKIEHCPFSTAMKEVTARELVILLNLYYLHKYTRRASFSEHC